MVNAIALMAAIFFGTLSYVGSNYLLQQII
jgi:hypothetical protein